MSRDDEFNTLAFYAFRYALGRMTYAVGDVCGILIKNKDKIDIYNKELMIKEIKYAIKNKHAGWECDVKDWVKVMEELSEQSTKISSETQP